jgi:hypothetical protein
MLFQSALEDSVIVGQTANTLGRPPSIGRSLSGGVHLVPGDDLKSPQLRNIDFIDQRDAGVVMIGSRLHPLSILENLRFMNTTPCRILEFRQLVGGFTDTDGSLRGDGHPVFVHGDASFADSAETEFDPAINAWVTPLDSLHYLGLTPTQQETGELGFTALVGLDHAGVLSDTSLHGQNQSASCYLPADRKFLLSRFDPLPDGIRIANEGRAEGAISLEIPLAGPVYIYEEAVTGSGERTPDFERLVASPGAGAFTLEIRSKQAVYVFRHPAGGLDLSFPETIWQSQKFGYHRLRNEGAEKRHWGSFADPDSDGLHNQLEFFLGSDPLRPNSAVTFNAEERSVSFDRNPAATHLAWTVSYSHDLRIWHADPQIEETELSSEAVRVKATAPNHRSHRKLFMLLRVHPRNL